MKNEKLILFLDNGKYDGENEQNDGSREDVKSDTTIRSRTHKILDYGRHEYIDKKNHRT